MTRIWLVRHGESLLNAAGRVQGWADAPLTPAGLAAASARAADFVRLGLRFDAIVSADGIRHRETARALSAGRAPLEDAGWREACFGALEGAKVRRLARLLAQHRDADDPLHAALTAVAEDHRGEHPSAVVDRAVVALDRVADTAGEALVVTSGITIMLLLRALGADLGHVLAGPPNLSVSVIEGYPGGWQVTRAVVDEV